jgi:hypothetical protein
MVEGGIMSIDYTVVAVILAVFGIGLVGIIQTIKSLLKLSGLAAYVLAFLCSAGATAFTLLQTHTFSILALVVYTFIVFGEATGLYKVRKS